MKKSIRQVFQSIQKSKKTRKWISPLEQHVWRDGSGTVTTTDGVRLLQVFHDKTVGEPVTEKEQRQIDRVTPRSVDCEPPVSLSSVPLPPMPRKKGEVSVKLGAQHFDRFYLPASANEWTIRTNRYPYYPAMLFHVSGDAVLVLMPLTGAIEVADIEEEENK